MLNILYKRDPRDKTIKVYFVVNSEFNGKHTRYVAKQINMEFQELKEGEALSDNNPTLVVTEEFEAETQFLKGLIFDKTNKHELTTVDIDLLCKPGHVYAKRLHESKENAKKFEEKKPNSKRFEHLEIGENGKEAIREFVKPVKSKKRPKKGFDFDAEGTVRLLSGNSTGSRQTTSRVDRLVGRNEAGWFERGRRGRGYDWMTYLDELRNNVGDIVDGDDDVDGEEED